MNAKNEINELFKTVHGESKQPVTMIKESMLTRIGYIMALQTILAGAVMSAILISLVLRFVGIL